MQSASCTPPTNQPKKAAASPSPERDPRPASPKRAKLGLNPECLVRRLAFAYHIPAFPNDAKVNEDSGRLRRGRRSALRHQRQSHQVAEHAARPAAELRRPAVLLSRLPGEPPQRAVVRGPRQPRRRTALRRLRG